ncbi:MAG: sigma-70 family RNA polymerase sigma factor [Myxococcota bacterium]|nr:sigma-70 family RNA polymerase sigma factor [Myxococcota bacterium]
MSAAAASGPSLEGHRRELFALCYRMTGSAADAEDLEQETVARAVERPPPDTGRPWRPWLVRVATNLARDHLRRRRRRGYAGPWLPEPVETEALLPALHEPAATAGRYELLESVSFAFLVALEALTPMQRAVLVLCDVLDYAAAEAAEALDSSPGAVRTTLHRARRRMAGYDAARPPPSPEVSDATRALLERFVLSMAAGDVAGMESLLAEDAVALNDGGGVYAAARVPVVGAGKVARFHRKLVRRGQPLTHAELRELNGLPALLGAYPEDPARPHLAPRFAVLPVPDRAGRLRMLCTVVAPAKLARLGAIAPLSGPLRGGS